MRHHQIPSIDQMAEEGRRAWIPKSVDTMGVTAAELFAEAIKAKNGGTVEAVLLTEDGVPDAIRARGEHLVSAPTGQGPRCWVSIAEDRTVRTYVRGPYEGTVLTIAAGQLDVDGLLPRPTTT